MYMYIMYVHVHVCDTTCITCTCILVQSYASNLYMTILGSRPHVSSLLVKLQELADCEEQLEMKSSELDKLNSRISEVEITSKK